MPPTQSRTSVVAVMPHIHVPAPMAIPVPMVIVAHNHDRRRRDHWRRRDVGWLGRRRWRRGRTPSQDTKAEKTKQRETFHEHLPIRNFSVPHREG